MRALVVTGAVTLRQVAPWVNWMTTFTGLAFTTTVRVVDRVHHHAANGRADTHPALHTGLAETAQAVLFVGDLANRGASEEVRGNK